MKRMITPAICILILFLCELNLYAGKNLEFSKEFALFTSKNASGYFKPLLTSIEQSLNSNRFTCADYEETWRIGLDISVMGMLIPSSQNNYDAELPQLYGDTSVAQTGELRDGVYYRNKKGSTLQPTIYGGASTPVFSAPQKQNGVSEFYKSSGFAEGNNITFMPGLPVLQLVVGIPTRTELRFRFLTLGVAGESMTYYAILLNQRLDHWFDIQNILHNHAIAVNLGFHSLQRDAGIDVTSFSAGLHGSGEILENFKYYAALQYETISGSITAYRENYDASDVINSPYEEIRLHGDQPLKISVESFTKFRVLGGLSYKLGFAEFHGDIAYASQPIFTFGICFNFVTF
ncbi:MAG: DUF6588 family protein [Bacteroidota bacterium]